MVLSINKKFHQLEATKLKFIQSFDSLNKEQLNFKPNGTDWSIMQVVDHLVSAEKEINKLFEKYNPYEATQKVQLKNHLSTRLLYFVFWARIKVKIPSTIAPPKGEGKIEDWLISWNTERMVLKKVLEGFPASKADKFVFKHPVVGAMTMLETLGFMRSHINHHIPQIYRIKKHKDFPST